MSANWLHNIKHVKPGEPVQAGVVGRPDRTLADRTDYLKERLDAAELGRAIFEVDATVSPDVLEGQPVYWNWVTNRYEPALVAVEQDPDTQVFTTQPSSDCVGICYKKKTSDRADIVLRGLVIFDNLTNSIGDTVVPGKYYLSAVEAGKLTKQKPPVTVVVCHVQGPRDNCSDKLRVLVMPQTRDYVEEHTHYRFDLVPRPAGTNTIVLDEEEGTYRHEITNPNPELQGWLPADSPAFRRDPDDPATNFAPPGALFGYNIKKHAALNRVWPPIPLQSVAILWDKGYDSVGATEIPLGAAGLAVCNANGIWWMSSCYGEVPWPDNYDPNTSFPNGIGDECPRIEVMRVVVVYLRMLLGNDRNVVTSLTPDTDLVNGELITSPVVLTNCDDLPATTGDLKVNVDLQFAKTEALGGAAVKGVTNRHQLLRGWVTEGAVTTTPQHITIIGSRSIHTPVEIIVDEETNETVFHAENHGYFIGTRVRLSGTLSSTLPDGLNNETEYFVIEEGLTANTFKLSTTENGVPVIAAETGLGTFVVTSVRYLSENEKTSLSIDDPSQFQVHQGLIRVDYNDTLVERELSPQIIRLSDTVERLYMDIPYLGFPAGQSSLLRVRINVPDVNFRENLRMKMRVRLFGRAGGLSAIQLPPLVMTRRLLPRPPAAGLQLPTVDSELDFSATNNLVLPADTVVECDSEEFNVNAGDTVLVTIERRIEDDPGYNNDVGVLRISGIVRAAE